MQKYVFDFEIRIFNFEFLEYCRRGSNTKKNFFADIFKKEINSKLEFKIWVVSQFDFYLQIYLVVFSSFFLEYKFLKRTLGNWLKCMNKLF